VVATNQADNLYGDGGANVIYAQAGDDRIVGGAGDDRLYGGAGADVFAFDARSGVDEIADFDAFGADHDVIAIQKNLNGSGIVDFTTLMAHIQQGQTALVLDLGAANEIRLTGVAAADLNAGLFFFY
jgi:Ca2+-binding RTX toxin-like protein